MIKTRPFCKDCAKFVPFRNGLWRCSDKAIEWKINEDGIKSDSKCNFWEWKQHFQSK